MLTFIILFKLKLIYLRLDTRFEQSEPRSSMRQAV